jgi:hypothetical protein
VESTEDHSLIVALYIIGKWLLVATCIKYIQNFQGRQALGPWPSCGHLLERLLVETLPQLVLAGVVVALVLVLAEVILVEGVVVLLGAVGDKVVRISTVVAAHLLITTPAAI